MEEKKTLFHDPSLNEILQTQSDWTRTAPLLNAIKFTPFQILIASQY